MAICLIALAIFGAMPVARGAEVGKIQLLKTGDGVAFSILGEKPAAPAPTLFIFALDAERTLNSSLYRQAGNILSERGYLCVSLDLPCHGVQRRNGEAAELKGWRQRIDAGENIMDEFAGRAKKVLDYLVAEKYTDPDKVAAGGTSRGAFSACHFAMVDPRIKCVAAYIPATDLGAITEFKGANAKLLKSLSLANNADRLADRGIWIGIGDQDFRASTDSAIEFARKLSAAAAAKKVPRNIELRVSSIDGHKTPIGAAEQSADWIQAILKTK